LAVLAKENGVPFYVAAPTSTIDLSLKTGQDIPIEERDEKEVTRLHGVRTAPVVTRAANPAFDVTPHRYITAIITERGIMQAPYGRALKEIIQGSKYFAP
jgi:methylthioribose-1-phosphate isomerase